jgi:hypothetical protein
VKKFEKPFIISIPHHGNPSNGFLNVFQEDLLPNFKFRRAYWTSDLPNGSERGNHAHKACTQVLFCLSGSITVFTELPDGTTEEFFLSSPRDGLVLWPHVWHQMKYQNAIQLVLASEDYDEIDYIRVKSEFYKYYKAL